MRNNKLEPQKLTSIRCEIRNLQIINAKCKVLKPVEHEVDRDNWKYPVDDRIRLKKIRVMRMKKPTPRERDSSSGNFRPVDQVTPSGERICCWRCTAMQKMLFGNWRQCNWVGRKDCCKSYTTHDGQPRGSLTPISKSPSRRRLIELRLIGKFWIPLQRSQDRPIWVSEEQPGCDFQIRFGSN
jgi:hypothetical protein